MTKLFLTLLVAACTATVQADTPTNAAPTATGTTVETLVCIRHGEKPKGGLGQLTCKGLNRALALPDVLLGKFGTPQFIFAPNPTMKVDGLTGYYYVRPLMTIEPTAIRCGLPVSTKYGYAEVRDFEKEMDKPEYHSATVFVAWEHGLLDVFAKNIVADYGGDAKQVPGWPGNDYDTIFIFKITRNGDSKSISFTIDHEGLNGMSDNCPGPAK
jgi:hypothetical protein